MSILRPSVAISLLCSILLFYSESSASEHNMSGFNFGNDQPSAAAKAIFEEAEADFDAVIAGRCPQFAKFDGAHELPADGGTTFYNGNGYSLTIVKSLAQAGGVHGYFYGPVITFEKVVAGNSNRISNVTFYSGDALRKILADGCHLGTSQRK